MSTKWYYESDGGRTHCGRYVLDTPKTHYVTNGAGERIDCHSKREALKLIKKLNGGTDSKMKKVVQYSGKCIFTQMDKRDAVPCELKFTRFIKIGEDKCAFDFKHATPEGTLYHYTGDILKSHKYSWAGWIGHYKRIINDSRRGRPEYEDFFSLSMFREDGNYLDVEGVWLEDGYEYVYTFNLMKVSEEEVSEEEIR